MLVSSQIFTAILVNAIGTLASPTHHLRETQLFQFDNTTFLENLFIRRNGNILLSSVNTGHLFDFDPHGRNQVPVALGALPGANGTTGVVEVFPDVYAVSGGLINMETQSFAEGSLRVYTIDFCNQKHSKDGASPIIKSVAQVKNTTMLNGMAALPHRPGVVLSVDSYTGRIFRIDTVTGNVETAWQDDLLSGLSDPKTGGTGLGANGIRIHDGWLYFAQSEKRTFGRVRIDADGHKIGAIQTFTTIPDNKPATWADDDFAITNAGEIYVARHPRQLVKIPKWGTQEVLLDESSPVTLYDPTSAAYDETHECLYVTTGGAFISGGTTGGQLIKVQF